MIHCYTESVSLGNWLIIFIISDSLSPKTAIQISFGFASSKQFVYYQLFHCSNPQSIIAYQHASKKTEGRGERARETYHRPPEAIGVFFQLLQSICLIDRTLNYLACSPCARTNVFQDSAQLIARRRVFCNIKLEFCPL